MRQLLPLLVLSASAPAWGQGFDAHGFYLASQDGDVRDPLTLVRPAPFTQGDVYGGMVLEYARKPLVEVITASGSPTESERAVIRDLGTVNVSAGIAPLDHWRLDLSMPVHVVTTDEDGVVGDPAPGDLRVHNTVMLLRPEHIEGGTGLGVGLSGHVDIPIGPTDRFLGKGGVGGGMLATVGYEGDVAHVSGGLGMQFNPSADIGNLSGADAFVAAVAAGVLAGDSTGINIEARLAPELSKNELPGAGTPGEAILSLKQKGPSNTHFTFGFAKAFAAGAGAADFRGFIGWGVGRIAPPRAPDFDGIEAPLAIVDNCPAEWETDNGWLDDDGCPDDLGSLTVRVLYEDKAWTEAVVSMEGLEEGVSKHRYVGQPLTFGKTMPGTKVNATAESEACLAGEGSVEIGEGPAELRIDMKRVLDGMLRVQVVEEIPEGEVTEEAPTEDAPTTVVIPTETSETPEEPDEDAPPPLDTSKYRPVPGASVTFHSEQALCVPDGKLALDGDARGQAPVGQGTHALTAGAPDFKVHERAFTIDGQDTQDLMVVLTRIPKVVVVQAPTRVKIEKKRIRIDDKIFFETNKAVIKEESFELLDEIATVVMDNPDVGRVEIGGHTDSQGGDAYNLGLSVRRASSVRSYLIARGVSPDRLEAAGYGETKPIANNDTAEGREQNRRVEFLLMDRQGEEEEEE